MKTKERMKKVMMNVELSKRFKVKAAALFSSALLTTFSGIGHAEDIEIFTNAFTSGGGPIANDPQFAPNVLLIIDTSTSMGRSTPLVISENIPLSQVPDDNSLTEGLEGNPQLSTGANAAAGPCDDNHSGATGDIDTKNFFFFYETGAGSGLYNIGKCETRLDTVKRSLDGVLSEMQADEEDVLNGLNIGVMRFNRNQNGSNSGGTVVTAVQPIDEGSNREDMINDIQLLDFGQFTSIAESLYESYRYFAGLTLDNGFNSTVNPGGSQSAFQVNFLDESLEPRTPYQTDPEARSGNTYDSPIQTQCQSNTVILLSDGLPSRDGNDNGAIQNLISSVPGTPNNVTCTDGDCADDIAAYMNENDVLPLDDANADAITATVNTFSIGLNIDNDTLREIGAAGTGEAPTPASTPVAPGDINPSRDYYTINDPDELRVAFAEILSNLANTGSAVFAAPSLAVDVTSGLQSRENIYLSLFEPSTTTRWGGNLKGYRITADGLVDRNGDLAIDPTTGLFFEASTNAATGVTTTQTAQSYWSDAPDGNNVTAGAAADNLAIAAPRNLFGSFGTNQNNPTVVDLSTGIGQAAIDNFIAAIPNAADTLNAIEVFSSAAQETAALTQLGANASAADIAAAAEESNLLGIAAFSLSIATDENGEPIFTPFQSNRFIGDNLHGTPYVLSFNDASINSGNPFDDVVFVTSNQGMLHAISGGSDATDGTGEGGTGEELWAYVPDESLFANLGEYFNASEAQKIYGLDSEIAFDVERDSAGAVENAVLFFGQRRGGDNIFAIDVTNANSNNAGAPVSHLWTRDATSGNGFDRLGQTWGEPIVAEVSYCDVTPCDPATDVRKVVFVSGGYDEQYDDATASVAGLAGNVQGNALLMLDAEDGELLWMAGDTGQVADNSRDLVIPEMENSIVAPPTVIDIDANGISDTIFFSDISGQVFRVDFRTSAGGSEDISGANNTDLVSGGIIADFAAGLTAANRRFYNPLEVALLPETTIGADTAAPRFAIATGSGYAAHPLEFETFDNNFYVVFDENIVGPDIDSVSGEPNYEYDNGDIIEPAALENLSFSAPVNFDFEPGSVATGGTVEFDTGLLGGGSVASEFGFIVPLEINGEKIIRPLNIFDFRLFATSYVPSEANANNFGLNCQADLGNGVVYSIDLLTGETIFIEPAAEGILPAPAFFFPGGVPVGVVGTQVIPLPEDGGPFAGIDPNPTSDPNDADCVGSFGVDCLNIGESDKKVWWEETRAGDQGDVGGNNDDGT